MKDSLLFRKLHKYRSLSCSEQWALLEAAGTLALSRLVLVLIPFQRIAGRFGVIGVESSATVPEGADLSARQVGWAVETMARHVPWESRCLVQAMSAWWMLNRRGINGTIYFGVAPAENSRSFNAHAWLRCGSRIVTGGLNHEKYSVLSCFTKGTP